MMQDHMDIEELLGAFALDAVDPAEGRIVERHTDVCARCRLEVEEHREVAALLGGDSVPSAGHVWEQIQAELSMSASNYHVVPVVRMSTRRPPKRSNQWMWAVAAGLFLALTAGLVVQFDRIGDLSARLSDQSARIETLTGDTLVEPLQQAVSAALQTSDSRVVSLTEPAGGLAAMQVVLRPDGTGFVFQNTLAPLPGDRTYQLWAVVEGRVISAGMLGSQPDVVLFRLDPEGLEGLVITQEVAGGVEKSEGDAVVAWFDA